MNSSDHTVAIIVAAGRGTRAGGDLPKQWQMLNGQPVLAHTLAAFAGLPRVLVIHPDDRARAEAIAGDAQIVEGGATRDASVLNALLALEGRGVAHVLIHDGARPLVSAAVIDRVRGALEASPAAAPALAVTDALWRGAAGVVWGLGGVLRELVWNDRPTVVWWERCGRGADLGGGCGGQRLHHPEEGPRRRSLLGRG
mgnify:CR=1 FL=1